MEKLCDLLQVNPGITALIGGGGKTSLMYQLSEELRERGTVLVCTTTKIWPPEHLPIFNELHKVTEGLAQYGVVCAGTPTEQGKLGEPAFHWQSCADYILVEADGSAGRPLKAHKSLEPVIPAGCNNTILVLGASGFGKPINEVAHRSANYAGLAGVPEDSTATAAVIVKVVNNEGLHDRIFINQTDTEKEWMQVEELSQLLDCPIVAGTLRNQYWKNIK